MSLSEIIQKRFKSKMKINQIKTPEDVEKFIISSPKTANVENDFDGSLVQYSIPKLFGKFKNSIINLA